MTDRIDVEELVERLKDYGSEPMYGTLDGDSTEVPCAVLLQAAAALSALEQYAALGRACESNGLGWYGDDGDMYFQAPADAIEEHATEWAKAALSALEKERDALKALVGRMVEGLEQIAEQATEFEVARAARSLLSVAKGEGER